jgi:hypothetical protein
MFIDVIDFGSCCQTNEIVEFLYKIFKNDFIDTSCHLANAIYIDPQSHKKAEGKEEIFWHIVTRKERGLRQLDKPRASKMRWIKPIILNYNYDKIKMFYYFEDTGKIRLYLWAFEVDFVVILQKLGVSSSYLVTSFYIDNQKKRDVFERKYRDYQNKKDIRLNGCEWF